MIHQLQIHSRVNGAVSVQMTWRIRSGRKLGAWSVVMITVRAVSAERWVAEAGQSLCFPVCNYACEGTNTGGQPMRLAAEVRREIHVLDFLRTTPLTSIR